jgi:hypothetical protein
MIRFPSTIVNNPARKGELAADKQLFGPRSNPYRYAVAPVHGRESVGLGWFVWDAETPDLTQERDPVMGWPPAIIRISTSLEEAVAGLA